MKRRLLVLLLAIGALIALAAADNAEYRTYYLKGWVPRVTRPYGPPDSAIVDSIQFGTTFSTPYIPCLGATMVRLEIFGAGATGSGADSDTVITCTIATLDTSSGNGQTILQSASINGTGSAQGAKIIDNAANLMSGVAASDTRAITVIPSDGSAVRFPVIPVRWIKFGIRAPSHGTSDRGDATIVGTFAATQTIHRAKIVVTVFKPNASFNSGYLNLGGNPDSSAGVRNP